jgi:DNA-binding NarL/FixJ family response regulator
MTNVVAIGKHPIVREGLKYICTQAPAITLVAEADDVEHALTLLDKRKCDVVILDNGVDAFERIKLRHPNLPVLVLSRDEHVQHVSRAIQAGVAGYVAMGSSPAEIINAIEAVKNGKN